MRILVFGCNGCAKEVVLAQKEENYVIGILDNNAKNMLDIKIIWGGREIPVYHPEQIKEIQFDFVVLPIPDHFESMKNQLILLGVDASKILPWNGTRMDVMENRIRMLRLCADRINELKLDGECAELGVYKGDFSSQISYMFPKRKMYLFDTFEGFDENELSNNIVNDYKSKNFADTSIDEVMRKMYSSENVIIRKGLFPNTAEGIEDKFAFVSIDADLYEPIKSGLEFFWPRMVSGGYIFVHDYGTYVYEGTKRAVDEFCREHSVAFIPILDRCLSAVFVKY